MEARRCLALVLSFAFIGSAAAGKKCYALAFSGGGDKGAFEAGVVKGLVDRIPAAERGWNVMTGISAGSILASAGALFNIGDEAAMADWMIDSTTSFTKANVFKQWLPLGVLTGLGKDGLFDTAPLNHTLYTKLGSRALGNRNFSIGATEDTTGGLVVFTEADLANMPWAEATARWATYVRASAAIPGIFQSIKVDGHVLSDGGVFIGVDVFSAVERCRATGAADADIVVDIAVCETKGVKLWNKQADDNAIDLAMRGLSVEKYKQQTSSILDACLAYPKVNWRYYVEPPASGLPSNGLDFNGPKMQEMVQIGLSQAAKAQPGAGCKTAELRRLSKQRWPVAAPATAVTGSGSASTDSALLV